MALGHKKRRNEEEEEENKTAVVSFSLTFLLLLVSKHSLGSPNWQVVDANANGFCCRSLNHRCWNMRENNFEGGSCLEINTKKKAS
ncbi:Uncharacterized protein APZ42_001847, partial [Daphnia magna]